jgi:hypothetical protein
VALAVAANMIPNMNMVTSFIDHVR